VHDPFNKPCGKVRRLRVADSIGIDLLPFKGLARRGKGGVYETVDLSVAPPRLVIIKEGRRHGETDWLGQDGFTRIQHEAHVLRSLLRHGLPVPEPLREFSERGNRYLMLQKVPGRPLLPRNRRQPAKSSCRRAITLLNRLAPLLKAIHRAGYVWRDCKPEHIFTSRERIFLIDFEGACRISETRVSPWGSHHYVPPIYRKEIARRHPGTLEDDYALGVTAFQFLSGKFPAASARTRSRVYKQTRCPDLLRAKIESLLKF
jgi:serine/threonine protein kinase